MLEVIAILKMGVGGFCAKSVHPLKKKKGGGGANIFYPVLRVGEGGGAQSSGATIFPFCSPILYATQILCPSVIKGLYSVVCSQGIIPHVGCS